MAEFYKTNLNQVSPEDLLNLRGHPVAYFPKYAHVLGGVSAALFISQLHYWHLRNRDPEGWTYRTMEELREETGLSKNEQRTARKILTEKGLLGEKRRGNPARLFYKIDWAKLVSLLLELDDKRCIKYISSNILNTSQDMYKTDNLLYIKDSLKETNKKEDYVWVWTKVIIKEINKLTARSYRPESKITNRDLRKRLTEGATLQDALLVVRDRWSRWKNKPEMREHLNPQTLFRPSHFEKYLIEAQAAQGDNKVDAQESEQFGKFLKKHQR